MATFEEVMALASLPETTLTLCLDARLAGQLAGLRAQLANAPAPTSIGQRSPALVIEEQIQAVVAQMHAAQVDFRLRALDARSWTSLWLARPDVAEGESAEDYGKRLYPWSTRLLSESCVDPVMTADQVDLLVDRIHSSAWNALLAACMNLNGNEVEVPNYVSVSEPTGGSGTTSPPPTDLGSPTASSSAANGRRRPRTATTTKVDVSAN